MELKKTVKYDGKLKGISVIDNQVVDADGMVINLIEVLSKAYGEKSFDLSTTAKTEELIDLEEAEEISIEDLQPSY